MLLVPMEGGERRPRPVSQTYPMQADQYFLAVRGLRLTPKNEQRPMKFGNYFVFLADNSKRKNPPPTSRNCARGVLTGIKLRPAQSECPPESKKNNIQNSPPEVVATKPEWQPCGPGAPAALPQARRRRPSSRPISTCGSWRSSTEARTTTPTTHSGISPPTPASWAAPLFRPPPPPNPLPQCPVPDGAPCQGLPLVAPSPAGLPANAGSPFA